MAQLIKAQLHNLDRGEDINFMFNPTQLKLQEAVQTAESPGARTDGGPNDGGFPKVSFSYTKARIVTISDIHFDTYETGDNVLKFLAPLLTAVRFVAGKQRPPIYTFLWGQQVYIRLCFVQQIDYTLTMFLRDGTPVRAVINTLSLKEADLPKPGQPVSTKEIDDNIREQDDLKKKTQAAKKGQ